MRDFEPSLMMEGEPECILTQNRFGIPGGVNTDEDVNGDKSSLVLNRHSFMNSSMDSKLLALYDKLTHIGIEQSICGKTLGH